MKILNFGSCNIDFVYSLEHIVALRETEQSDSLEIFSGGKGLNQSVALARAGASVYHAGCIGIDGDVLFELMKENNIDVSNVKKVNERNGHAIIQLSKKGENSIFIYPGSNGMITKDFVDEVLLNFEKGDILVLQNEISNVDYIVKEGHKRGMTIVFNPSPYNEKIEKINYNFIDYLIFNEVEGEMLTGECESKKIISRLNEKYPALKGVLTLGEKGCVYFDREKRISQSAFCVESVDTTAAGDTFTGYFIAGISKRENVETALKLASVASALAVSKKGASPSIPYRNEVLHALETLTERRTTEAETIKRIDRYIEKNLKNSNLGELANLLGYSVSYTQSIIKKLYHSSFSKTVQKKCCFYAEKMLRETDLPVSEIIRNIGYENESFFRNIFKERYGKNMLEYRKATKGEK